MPDEVVVGADFDSGEEGDDPSTAEGDSTVNDVDSSVMKPSTPSDGS